MQTQIVFPRVMLRTVSCVRVYVQEYFHRPPLYIQLRHISRKQFKKRPIIILFS